MTEPWTRLLDSRTQPTSLRESHELLEDFVAALREPSNVDDPTLPAESAARLGYPIAAARLLAGAQPDESWTRLGAVFGHAKATRLARATPCSCGRTRVATASTSWR